MILHSKKNEDFPLPRKHEFALNAEKLCLSIFPINALQKCVPTKISFIFCERFFILTESHQHNVLFKHVWQSYIKKYLLKKYRIFYFKVFDNTISSNICESKISTNQYFQKYIIFYLFLKYQICKYLPGYWKNILICQMCPFCH